MKNFGLRPVVRTLTFTIVLILAGVCVFFILRGPQGIPAVLDKRRQIRDLQEQNARLEKENREKRERIRKLREDRSELELEIRKRHKLLKENETTFILQDQSK